MKALVKMTLLLTVVSAPIELAWAEHRSPPLKPNIRDVAGDANFVNDQGLSEGVWTPIGEVPGAGPRFGDVHAASVMAAGDVLAAWFSNNAQTISAHIHTAAMPDPSDGLFFRVFANPDPAAGSARGCIAFVGIPRGTTIGTYQGRDLAFARDYCGRYLRHVDGRLTVQELEDTSSIITITVPRTFKGFATGAEFARPLAHSRIAVGALGRADAQVDSTARGTTYRIK